MASSKLPKVFSIFVNNGKKEGYVRFKSYKTGNKIQYKCTLVDDIKDASKYINFDNVKKEAISFYKKYGFIDIKVVDDKNLKMYCVKRQKES